MTSNPERRFADLHALYINCTLTRSPDQSHTQTLMDRSIEVMEHNGVSVTTIRGRAGGCLGWATKTASSTAR